VEHGQALRRGISEVHGVGELQAPYVQIAGRTDGAIARDLLLAGGIAPARIDEGVAEVRDATCKAYAELLEELAGMPERFRLSLLTGNFEPVARLKLERAGLGGHFPAGQGAFGSDAEAREELPSVARHRAGERDGGGPWPRERTLIIGDTPRDVLAARADQLRCIAVATGPFPVEELAEADFVARDGHEVAEVLRALE
jgi:phosphoglycolate phosphatase